MMTECEHKEGVEQIVPVSELERMPDSLFSQYADFILKKMEEVAGEASVKRLADNMKL